MGDTPIFQGICARFTKVNRCGLPLEGLANRIVTTGYVSVKVDPVRRERQESEVINAQGRVCFMGTTPATRKYHKVDIMFCGVNPDIYGMFTGHERILDYDNKTAIGIGDAAEVDDKTGVAVELWTAGQSDDDCPEPANDDVFSLVGSGLNYGYLHVAGTEWVPSGISVEAKPSDFSLSGISIQPVQWGRGPYNVARTDAAGTAGRLLKPIGKKRHLTFFRTPVEPPAVTNGAVPLAVKTIFDGKYFGAQSLAVAPAQPAATGLYPAEGLADADGLYPAVGAADADGLYPAPAE